MSEFLLAPAFVGLATLLLLRLQPNWRRCYLQRRAARALDAMTAQTGGQTARVVAFVRSMPRELFSEVVLAAVERAGHEVRRSKDGDATVRLLDGTWILLRSRRFRSTIRLDHVADFVRMCRDRDTPGLFVHSGRTCTDSREHALGADVGFVSGCFLAKLLLGEPIPAELLPSRRRAGPPVARRAMKLAA
jgi:restriction system protein